MADGGDPLMRLQGSVLSTNRWKPNSLTIYNDRVEEVIPARALPTALLGKHDRHVIRYEQVAAVNLHTGVKWSSLSVESTGGHTAVVNGLSKRRAQEAKSLIEERLVAVRAQQRQETGHQAASAAVPMSTADELTKLASLRDSGVLTEEEFAAAKKQLLERGSS